jgi:shikimate dehydrogenase
MPPVREVYTEEDIPALAASGKTLLAVIGDPVAHSLSPQMHEAAIRTMCAEGAPLESWRYVRLRVPPEDLPRLLPKLHAAGFTGLNLTIPHKIRALSLIEKIDPAARLMGAVNTLRRTPTGYCGYNTDGYGLEKAVEQELGQKLEANTIILLGAGGAAQAIAVHCLQAGCARLWIANRSPERLETLLKHLRQLPEGSRVSGFLAGERLPENLPRKGLLINATSLGLHADDPLPFPAEALHDLAVYDTTYARAPSALARVCAAQNRPYADGRAMLAWQGARALEIWTQRPVPTEAMYRVLF